MVVANEATGSRVLFVGDSITHQWSRHRPFFFDDHGFINRGIGGQTTRDLLARFQTELERFAPAGVHLMGGLNDIAGNGGPIGLAETRDNLAAMMAAARGAGCTVLLASVTPAAILAWNRSVEPAGPIMELNAALRTEAENTGATYLDYHHILRDPAGGLKTGIGPDGSHLDAAGYRLIEPLLVDAVARLFGREGFVVPSRRTRWLRGLRLQRPPAHG